MHHLPFSEKDSGEAPGQLPVLKDVLSTFMGKSRSLVWAADLIEKKGAVRVSIRFGAPLTSEAVMDALENSSKKSKATKMKKRNASELSVTSETAAALRLPNSMSAARASHKNHLNSTTENRRLCARSRTALLSE